METNSSMRVKNRAVTKHTVGAAQGWGPFQNRLGGRVTEAGT